MTEKSAANFLDHCRQEVDNQLIRLLGTLPKDILSEAMTYSLMAGGKRIRPALCYASASLFAPVNSLVHRAAMALELIHTYSLIHDDLPAMDNDDLRRGKPTCHVAFNEAAAILAGDALQTLAFETLASPVDNPATQLRLITLLAEASGAKGMVLGQAIDLNNTNKQVSAEELETMHRYKTGALITTSILAGALASGKADAEDLATLKAFGDTIGLAFQVKDDILDVEGSTDSLGKQQGADAALNKSTYISSLGLAGAKSKLQELHSIALTALLPFGDRSQQLEAIANFIVSRSH